MAVALKNAKLFDRGHKKVDISFYHVTKSNRRGVAEAIGGDLVLEIAAGGQETGWYIWLVTKVNGKKRGVRINNRDFVFRTNKNTRWQVLDRAGFNKRFSVK